MKKKVVLSVLLCVAVAISIYICVFSFREMRGSIETYNYLVEQGYHTFSQKKVISIYTARFVFSLILLICNVFAFIVYFFDKQFFGFLSKLRKKLKAINEKRKENKRLKKIKKLENKSKTIESELKNLKGD